MCFDRFLLAVESRDLSQADKRITRVSSFLSFNFWLINYSCIQKSYLGLWQNCFGQFITQKCPSLKSKQFSQFFLVIGKSERIDKIYFQKVQASGLRDRKRTFTTHHSVWERKHSYYFCQLEIDHVTQKPKETCQSTCGGLECTVQANLLETSPFFVCPNGFGEHIFSNVYSTWDV